MALSACAQPPAPAPTQSPAPAVTASPTPVAVEAGWRDAPITPGNWSLTSTTAGSVATFAGGKFLVQCNVAQHMVSLVRAGTGIQDPAQLAVTTSQGVRMLPASSSAAGIAATVAARDPLLDAMAFSRGRFAVSATGSPALYVPSWTEVSRVVEDCR